MEESGSINLKHHFYYVSENVYLQYITLTLFFPLYFLQFQTVAGSTGPQRNFNDFRSQTIQRLGHVQGESISVEGNTGGEVVG